MIYIIIIPIILITLYFYIYLLKVKINKLEVKIIKNLNWRTNLVPILFEITKGYLNKHNEIFKEIIKLKKIEFINLNVEQDLENIFNLESLIHHELNFIFKVCDKNKKLDKNERFLYIKELFSTKSLEISDSIELYKKISLIYNKFIHLKNLTIIWFLVPLKKI